MTEQDYNDLAELNAVEADLPASIQKLQGKVNDAQDFFNRFGCLSDELFNDAQATLKAAKAELDAALAEYNADPGLYLQMADDAGQEADYAALRAEM